MLRVSGFLMALFFCHSVYAGSQLSMESLAADGQEVRSLSCELEEGLFLGLLQVVASLAPAKTSMETCVGKPAAFRVEWSWGQSHKAEVLDSSAIAKNHCILSALKSTKGPRGTCKGIILVGDTARALEEINKMK